MLLAAGAGAIGLLAWSQRSDAKPSPKERMLLDFGRPVPKSVRAIVSSGWSRPRGDRLHRALDIPVPVGTPICSLDAGVVVRAQTEDKSDAGIWVGVLHASGVTSRYLHLSRCSVKVGERVARGQVLGESGNTGNSEGPHLHLDLRVPEYLLPIIESQAGTPPGGWGPILEPWGRSIPGEPWVPVDGYRPQVKRDAIAAGIKLREEVRHGG